jgi:hypothetical protein
MKGGEMYQVGFYVPESHLEQVKAAIFDAGAGHIGNYDRCCWQTLGQGQFRPLQGSDPAIGKECVLETVQEYRVLTVCEETVLRDVLAALRKAHPYEEPAFDVVQLVRMT